MKLDYTNQFLEYNTKAYIISFTPAKKAFQVRLTVTILDCKQKQVLIFSASSEEKKGSE